MSTATAIVPARDDRKTIVDGLRAAADLIDTTNIGNRPGMGADVIPDVIILEAFGSYHEVCERLAHLDDAVTAAGGTWSPYEDDRHVGFKAQVGVARLQLFCSHAHKTAVAS